MASSLWPSVLVVETVVDPDQFCGTVDTLMGWRELGKPTVPDEFNETMTFGTINPNGCS